MPKITPVDLQARKREGCKFPADEHTYHIDPKELAKLEAPRKLG